jgi:3-mercaptopyruvate sulfurtransferase SseA
VNGTGPDRVVILDVQSAATYSTAHIPGALQVTDTDLYQVRQEGPAKDVNMVLDGAAMDALVQKYGIDNNTTIVFTGGSGAGSIPLAVTRAYWTFRYWGFPKSMLKLLDGLNGAWTAAGNALVADTPTVAPSTYSVKSNAAFRPELRASLSEMIAVASGSVADAVILDARSSSTTGSYAGNAAQTAGVFAPAGDFVVFEGHMKGAQALDYRTMYDGTTFRFQAPEVLAAAFATVGVSGAKTTYVHCRTGMIASLAFFALDGILGWPAANYDASWSQWGQLSADAANGGTLSAGSPWITDTAALSEGITYNHATQPVELLTSDGGSCSGTLGTGNVTTYTPTGCDGSFVPDSSATSGNQVEEEDALYML